MVNNEKLLPQQEAALTDAQQEDFIAAWDIANAANQAYDEMRSFARRISEHSDHAYGDICIKNFAKRRAKFETLQEAASLLFPPRLMFDEAYDEYFDGSLQHEASIDEQRQAGARPVLDNNPDSYLMPGPYPPW